jgi:hypothetical protein
VGGDRRHVVDAGGEGEPAHDSLGAVAGQDGAEAAALGARRAADAVPDPAASFIAVCRGVARRCHASNATDAGICAGAGTTRTPASRQAGQERIVVVTRIIRKRVADVAYQA